MSVLKDLNLLNLLFGKPACGAITWSGRSDYMATHLWVGSTYSASSELFSTKLFVYIDGI